jgi:hypothetical protein
VPIGFLFFVNGTSRFCIGGAQHPGKNAGYSVKLKKEPAAIQQDAENIRALARIAEIH